MEHPLITDFIDELKPKIYELPQNEQQGLIAEIKDHILTEIEIKKDNGIDEETDITETIAQFKADKKNIYLIVDEHKKDKDLHFEGGKDLGFVMTAGLAIGNLGALSAPILRGYFEIGTMLPWLMFLIGANIVLYTYYSKRMSKSRTKTIKQMWFVFPLIVALPFVNFAINLTSHGYLNTFSAIYVIIYLVLVAATYFGMRRLYNENKFMLE